jgi:hypothetical protein
VKTKVLFYAGCINLQYKRSRIIKLQQAVTIGVDVKILRGGSSGLVKRALSAVCEEEEEEEMQVGFKKL